MQSEAYCGNEMIVPIKKLELAPGAQWHCLQGSCSEFFCSNFSIFDLLLKI